MQPDELEASIQAAGLVLFAGLGVYLIAELVLLHVRGRRLRLREARACGLGFGSTVLVAGLGLRIWGYLSVAVAASAAAAFSPVEAGLAWPWWIYGWLVYEFWYWVQHWAAHKTRLLWCMHAPHHAPRSIHMLVGFNHHFSEVLFYFPFFFGVLPALCGVHPVICVAVNLVDGIWGNLLHVSDEIVPRGRYGWLGRFLQTPAHHRVHHAVNPRYLDTNYNSITLLWDWVFGTLQPLRDDDPCAYGITREMDTGSFWDLHFGEFRLLARDVWAAGSWRDRLGYVCMPPGWQPGGAGKTVADVKRAFELGT